MDFYTGIVLRAIGIPLNMFTVMFAIGRLPGWIAQWKESVDDPKWKIHRPHQIYLGSKKRDYVPIGKKGGLYIFAIFSTMAAPNSEHFTSFASGICLARS